MIPACDIDTAAALLRGGALLGYPTEAVYGLGCDPRHSGALDRLLGLKGRPRQKGLILIAASLEQVRPWLAHPEELEATTQTWPGPISWVFSSAPNTPDPLRRTDHSIAIRLTAHPVASALCQAFGGALVSTSANPAGLPPARDHGTLERYFDGQIQACLSGALGARQQPSEIRDARSGEILRP